MGVVIRARLMLTKVQQAGEMMPDGVTPKYNCQFQQIMDVTLTPEQALAEAAMRRKGEPDA